MRRAAAALILLLTIVLATPGSAALSEAADLDLVSASAAGIGGNAESFGPALSDDGTLVAFSSTATNLHPADGDGQYDVYLKNLATGSVTLVSTAADGTKANGRSVGAAITADGTRVAFSSGATNLHATGVPGIYVKDLRTGAVLLASTTQDGIPANAGGESLSLSADGTRIAFSTVATNLDARDPIADSDVYVKDLVTGRLWLASVSATGEKKVGLFGATVTSLAADGGSVAFHSDADGLHPADTDQKGDVFVRDLETGDLTLASTNDDGVKGNGQSSQPSLSADGTKVAFTSYSTNLDPDVTSSGFSSVYVKDLTSGELTLASRTAAGAPILGGGFGISLSADATRIAFASLSRLADPADVDAISDVYVKDLATGALFLASTTQTGVKGNGASYPSSLAPGGDVVAFRSDSTNLHPADGDSAPDVYAKALGAAPQPAPSERADLSVVQTDSPDPVLAGQRLTYELRVRNDGPAVATDVTLVEELDAGVRLESVGTSHGTCAPADTAVRCALGSMAAGETADLTVIVTPSQQGNVAARATVHGAEPDPDAFDNSSQVSTKINAAADLSIELSDTPDPVRVRDRVAYRAELANAGPSVAAADVAVELPDGLSLLSVDGGGGDCRVERGTVRCFFTGIDPGERPAVVVSGTAKRRGTLATSATVSPFLLADPVSANNADTETTTVLR